MIVEMRDICKDYPSDSGTVHVLKDVCLDIEKGDYIAIMGPSGSGKTTLMNIIGFLDLPTSGTYLLNGADETQSNEDHLAEVRNRHIGFVFQTFYLLPGLTALENVALPLLYADVPIKERNERAAEALRQVGLEDRLDFYPRQLSGGQSQRVAIARAMVAHPQLLLADEPTGALDSTAGSQIMEIFKRLNEEGMTIVMITHELAVARCAKKVFHILDGRLSYGNEASWEAALSGNIPDQYASVYGAASGNLYGLSAETEPGGADVVDDSEAYDVDDYEADVEDCTDDSEIPDACDGDADDGNDEASAAEDGFSEEDDSPSGEENDYSVDAGEDTDGAAGETEEAQEEDE